MKPLNRPVTDAEIKAYQDDGVVCLRGFFDVGWVEEIRDQIEQDISNPSGMVKNINQEGATGYFFGDTFVCHHIDGFMGAVLQSPAAQLAAAVMKSKKVNLIFDQILVKEPGTSTPTIWHQDLTYWPVLGEQICTLWLALDDVDIETGAVEFLRGSHRWGQRYLAVSFDPEQQYDEDLPPVPDVEAERDNYEIVHFDMAPGDCTIHQAALLHYAPPNTSGERRRRAYIQRWGGDDVTYNPRPNLQKMLRDPGISPGAPLDSSLFPLVIEG